MPSEVFGFDSSAAMSCADVGAQRIGGVSARSQMSSHQLLAAPKED